MLSGFDNGLAERAATNLKHQAPRAHNRPAERVITVPDASTGVVICTNADAVVLFRLTGMLAELRTFQ